MILRLLATASALAVAMSGTAVAAQHQHMPGMSMPMPAKPAPQKKKAKAPAAKKAPAKRPLAPKPIAKATSANTHPEHPAAAPDSAPAEPAMDHSQMDHPTTDQGATAPMDHSTMDHSTMEHGGDAPDEHADHASAMTGTLGTYPMTREASGTAWQPDNSLHGGVHAQSGDWMLMGHGVLNLVLDTQGSERGDTKLFPSGMIMGMARRPLGNGTLQFRAMLSPDPVMGKRGYPLLLAAGETANGVDRLIDRQHPHDFFMELSASVSQPIGTYGSVFLYGGLPGEPAFGPPTFMHRESIMDSPEAPISHHWLDSTHISFGVLTAGLVLGNAKLEISRFNGREPDQHRWNIETGALDSTAVRLSWNPTAALSLQGSWGHFVDPEQLEPGVDQKRLSASALYAREVAPGWKLAGTLAWGRKSIDHHGESFDDDAFAAEASLKHRGWTMFGRGEVTENRELVEGVDEEHGEAFRVGKVSLGLVRDFAIGANLALGVGGLLSMNFIPDGLADLYGKSHPTGAMGFVRIKLD